MVKLEQLIQEKCPNGVEYKRINEIAEKLFSGGTPKTSNSEYYDGDIKWLRSGEINFNHIYDTEKTITELGLNESSAKIVPPKSVLIALTGATVARVGVNEVELSCNQSVCSIVTKNTVDYMFLYYFLESKYKELKNIGQGALTSLNLNMIKNIELPVPPLEVQREIVEILDKFSNNGLEGLLKNELILRKSQYEYYKNYLISNSTNNVVKLKDIAVDVYRGTGIKREEVTEEDIPCVRYGEIYTTYDTTFDECKSHTDKNKFKNPKYFEHGDILFAITGESVEDIAKSIAYLGNEKCLAGGDIVVLKHNQEPRYLAYALSTYDANMQKGKGKVKSKVVHSNVPSILEISIPLPELSEQKRISDILDRFHQIINNTSDSIPAEIEARQKQYEYYRDKLLTFKRLEA